MRNLVLAAAAAALMAGCTSSGGSTVTALSPELARSARVTEVRLAAPPQGASNEFATVFAREMNEHLSQCATGSTPLRVEVTLHQFSRANPAMTWLIADSNRISGNARLVDPSTNQVVGEYEIARAFSASGLIGVAMMSEAEEQMSGAFGDELCNRAFPARDGRTRR